MSASTTTSGAALPAWRDPARWATTTDVIAVLIALSLPWSTSLVGIFGVLLLIAVAPTIDLRAFWTLVKRPICAVPAALFALALVGTLWSDAAWGARLYAVEPTAKLLVLPFLFYHFERSRRGTWVFTAFLVSCTLLMVMSWLVLVYPGLSLKPPGGVERGIFVKDYINQSQEFTLCAVALAYPFVMLLQAKRIALAVLLVVIALSFFANMAFVVVSRTALVTVPIMFAVFALLHLRWRSITLILCSAAVLAVVAWYSSPQLRWTAETFTRDYQLYKERNEPTSIGLRLEFWRKSLGFFAEAPIIGHGTGATRGLFERVATHVQRQASSEVIGNPHNQTLNVAVQWGILGVVILYAMWILHLLLFRGGGLGNWIGLLVVVQNIFTSLFNSHIFDFHEGWMYVLGVGVAGGMALKTRSAASVEPERSIHP
ncbi:O-antigen ligase family protein [Bradyrhizobium sp. ISRA443]|uniref:O-antigen ligase family protein n=1 Tax=unclassified Bradyrhizobium TaxID=2631580 RepID=UPI0024791CF8|nr:MULTISPECIES: O-antigen ligase family protein [unclassified Bradyrhizobium]WGR92876.1 O-antigen ligase family protein [Bradyrhizobium sp. ISRA435]WGR97368.1 O-antigen ligase family protein [Bradyrhizobium sp. ISRA436]WGS04256.1 O-antigen ligase family protein [Bradyrhizobium sp. ISRA437]WGS11140.1 O-antigen ligase family protein [Bradyrhizobium sp. ISRA443]